MTKHQLLQLQRHLMKAHATYAREVRSYPMGDPVRSAIASALAECEAILAIVALKLRDAA